MSATYNYRGLFRRPNMICLKGQGWMLVNSKKFKKVREKLNHFERLAQHDWASDN